MNVSGTMNSATGHTSVSTRTGNFSDGLYDKAGARPDLDLDFARTKSLKDRVSKEDLITFSRSSGSTGYGATYVDESGLVKRSPVNIMPYSSDISSSSFVAVAPGVANDAYAEVVLATDQGIAPDGSLADALKGTGETARHTLRMIPTIPQSNTQYVMSIFVKKLKGTTAEKYVSLETAIWGTWATTGSSGAFDLDTGTRVSNPNSGISSGIEDFGNGWYRIYFVATTASATTSTGFYLNASASTGAVGSTTLASDEGFLVWGAQMEVGSVPTTYIPTNGQASGAPRFTHDPVTKESKGLLIEQQATNLSKPNRMIGSSSNRVTMNSLSEQAAGQNTNGVVGPNGSAVGVARAYFTGNESDPTGGVYVFNRTGDGSGGNPFKQTTYGTGIHTSSVFIKPALETRWIIAAHSQYASASAGGSAAFLGFEFNLTGDGTVISANNALISHSIQKYPNGWYRVSITYYRNSTSPVDSPYGVLLYAATHSTYNNFVSNTGLTSGELGYFWGPQVETGEVATSYIPTNDAEATRSPDLASIEGDNFGTYRKNITLNTDHLNFRLLGTDGHECRWQYGDINVAFPFITYQIPNPIDGKYNAALVDTTTIPSARKRIKCTFDSNVGPANNYVFSAYVKPVGTNSRIQFLTNRNPNSYVNFNLNTNTVTKGLSADFAEIQTVGSDGWKRIIWKPSNAVEWQAWNIHLRIGSDTEARNTGSTDNKFYIYGPQIEEASAVTPYIPSTDKFTNRQSDATFVDGNGIIRTAKKNHLLYSEDISQWLTRGNGGSVTVTMDAAAVDPYGGLGVSKVQCSRTDLGHYQAQRHVAVDTGTAQPNVQSAWLKAATPADVGKIVSVWQYDSGFIINDSHTLTADWVRYVSPVANAPNAIVSEPVNYGQLNVVHGGPDQTSVNFYIWGTQMVTGTEAGDYVKTEATATGPARYSHDPETLTPTGLYLEPAAINYARQSERFDLTDSNNGEPWFKGGSSFTTDNSVTKPDGTTGALKLIPDSTNTRSHISYFIDATTASSDTVTLSVFVKAAGYNRVALISQVGEKTSRGVSFDLTTGTIQSVSTDSTATDPTAPTAKGEIHKYPNGWFRIVVHPTTSANPTHFVIEPHSSSSASVVDGTPDPDNYFRVTYSGDPSTGDGMYLWGAQLEETANVTSYIPTKDSQVDRTADIFTSTATEVLDRANGTKPAFFTTDGISYFAAWQNLPNTTGGHLSIFNNNGGSFFRNSNNSVGFYSQYDGSTQNINFLTANDHTATGNTGNKAVYPNSTVDDPHKAAFRFKHNDFIIYADGIPGTPDPTTPTIKKSEKMFIGGNAAGETLKGTLSRIAVWKTGLTNNKLDRITS